MARRSITCVRGEGGGGFGANGFSARSSRRRGEGKGEVNEQRRKMERDGGEGERT